MSPHGPAGDLRAQGPLEVLDDALAVLRHSPPSSLVRACAGALPLALCALATYYFERVEGVHSLRPLLALSFALAFCARAVVLSATARECVLSMRSGLPPPAEAPRAIDVVSTAAIVGLGLWVWLWPLAGAALLTPLGALGVLPFVALRGAVAPSWLARAACEPGRGLRAFGQALDDTHGMRSVFLIVEMLVLFGAIGLFANLYALLGFSMLLGHALLGLDVAFVSSFLSPQNAFLLLLLGALTLIALEPLRAAVSAQAFVGARTRRDGADLHAAVDAAIAGRAARRSARPRAKGALVAALIAAGATQLDARAAHAQAGATPDAPAESAAQREGDDAVRAEVEHILAAPEFREFAESDTRSLYDVLERLFKWLEDPSRDDKPPAVDAEGPRLQFSPWVLMGVLILALLVLSVFVLRSRAAARSAAAGAAEPAGAAPRPAASPFDEAARHAALGDARTALRFLYGAVLGALDRSGAIEYEPSKTNWHYLRALPAGERREAFAAFTRVFDRTFYGHAPATLDDYERCRQLCDRVLTAGAA
jgi:hypothetical protein